MNKKKFFPVVTVPLAPYVQPGKTEPIKTKRLRPKDALDIEFLVEALEANTVMTKVIKGHPWSIISVYSPYSVDIHVMLMETGMRYLPSPEYIDDVEGTALMKLWIKIVNFLKKRDNDQRIFIGYNWSPRSWGEIEEVGGFQSIPTKWHPMFWSWPEFKEDKPLPYLSWEKDKDIKISFRRMNGENSFVASIAAHIKKEADQLIQTAFGQNFIQGVSLSNEYGFSVTFNCDLESLLGKENFFSGFLRPLSVFLNNFFATLSEIFLANYKSSAIDAILQKTSTGKLSGGDIKFIRSLPSMRKDDDIKKDLKNLCFSQEAIDELVFIVKNREKYANFFDKIENDLRNDFKSKDGVINELLSVIGAKCQDDFPAWRKGFAYALVFEELKDSDNKEITILKIVPAAYLGDGGIVEAKGVVLKRPEDAKLPIEQLRNKSEELYMLIGNIYEK